jgi:hypothetical protein
MYPELTGPDGRDTKATLSSEKASVRLQVNGRYPASEPLLTIPPNLLANLPQLPEDMEYRVVGKDLVLRDVDACRVCGLRCSVSDWPFPPRPRS